MFDSWWGHGDYINGPLAQLARALPWHGRGQGFKSLMVHNPRFCSMWNQIILLKIIYSVHKNLDKLFGGKVHKNLDNLFT